MLLETTNPQHVYQITETHRIAAYYETGRFTWQDCLGDGFNLFQIDNRRNYDLQSSPAESAALTRLTNAFNYYSHPRNYEELRERAIGRYLSAAGYSFKFLTLRGYSQGEVVDVVVYSKDFNAAADDWKELNAWFAGDVYYLADEFLKVYTAADGETIERWESADIVGGVILTDDYTLNQAAFDTLGVGAN